MTVAGWCLVLESRSFCEQDHWPSGVLWRVVCMCSFLGFFFWELLACLYDPGVQRWVGNHFSKTWLPDLVPPGFVWREPFVRWAHCRKAADERRRVEGGSRRRGTWRFPWPVQWGHRRQCQRRNRGIGQHTGRRVGPEPWTDRLLSR